MIKVLMIYTILLLSISFPIYSGGRQEALPEVKERGNVNEKNNNEEVIIDWNGEEDLFPAKVDVKFAEGFSVEYFSNYKIVNVLKPYPGAAEGFSYLLVQKGTPVPQDFGNSIVIEVPVKSFVSMSTSYLGGLKMLGVDGALTGVDSGKYIYDNEIRRRVADYRIVEVSSEYEPNIETLLSLSPDLIMASALGNKWDVHPKMLEVNLPVVINGEWNETSPLGRAEWLKFLALFFNKEKEAGYLFDTIEQQYTMLRDAVEVYADESPSVFTGAPLGDSWDVPGGKSYLAALLNDAGANYIWKDTVSTGSIPVSFETVFYKAGEADFWLNAGWNWMEEKELISFDERLVNFKAYRNGNVYANTGRFNKDGGNDYWETGVANPQVLLADLIKILHPDLLPDHELVYYMKLGKE